MNLNIKTILTIIVIGIVAFAFSACSSKPNSAKTNQTSTVGNLDKITPGNEVSLNNEIAQIPVSEFAKSSVRFYNIKLSGKTIYFLIVKDQKGIYHAAANACKVCFGTMKGFHSEGNEIVCNNCGNRYPFEKIATEKGGCNPGPINANVPVKNGNLTIKGSELSQISDLFLN